VTTLRRLAALLALGAVLATGQRVLRALDAAPPPLTVPVPAGATAAQVAAATREEALLSVARAQGWDRTDPVVSRQLVADLRATGVTGDDDALLAQARSLGLDRTDPVIRARLADRARRALAARIVPDTATLLAWRDAHPDTFRRPDRVRFAQAFLATGASPARVAALRAALPGVDPDHALALGDPLLEARPVATLGLDRTARWLGPDVAAALRTAPVRTWVGPVTSPHGLHWLYVLERTPGAVPPLSAIRAEVEADWRHAIATDRLRARIDHLVAAYDVRVVRQ